MFDSEEESSWRETPQRTLVAAQPDSGSSSDGEEQDSGW